jgi:5-methylcytosine-specific restriction enzyme A
MCRECERRENKRNPLVVIEGKKYRRDTAIRLGLFEGEAVPRPRRRKPKGTLSPEKVKSVVVRYKRLQSVINWVLDAAKGLCEGCGQPAPFVKMDGEPYFEVHHVIWLEDGGADNPENAAALCPNCHRRCHSSVDRDEFTQSLYGKVTRLVPKEIAVCLTA